MKTYGVFLIVFAAGLAAAPARAGAKEYDAVSDTVTSADGKHTAFIAKLGDHSLAVIDGVEGKEYDSVQCLRFSADGSRVGYIVEFPGGRAAVIDGVEGKHYIACVTDLVFSSDGKHAAYMARRGTRLNNHTDDVVVIDGVEGTPYLRIEAGSLRYSPDGKHLAFAADVPAQTPAGRELRVFVDGKPISRGFDELKQGPDYDSVLLFSPDSRRVAYLASRNQTWFVGVDGQEGKGYEYIEQDSIRFSADGRHVAYVSQQRAGGTYRVVVDGEEGADYDEISDLQFSDDGSVVTFVGRRGATSVHVRVGKNTAVP